MFKDDMWREKGREERRIQTGEYERKKHIISTEEALYVGHPLGV